MERGTRGDKEEHASGLPGVYDIHNRTRFASPDIDRTPPSVFSSRWMFMSVLKPIYQGLGGLTFASNMGTINQSINTREDLSGFPAQVPAPELRLFRETGH